MRTPSSPTTISSDRSMQMPTRTSGAHAQFGAGDAPAGGPGVQLAIGHLLAFKDHGDLVRGRLRLGVEQIVKTHPLRVGSTRVSIPFDAAAAFAPARSTTAAPTSRRSGLVAIAVSNTSKCPSIRLIVALSNRSVLYSSDPDSPRPVSCISSVRSNLEVRKSGATGLSLRFGEPHVIGGNVLKNEHHLKQRRAAQVPLRLQLLNQLFEREILVCVGLERPLPRLCQQLGESQVAGHLSAEDQGVHEQADELFELRTVFCRRLETPRRHRLALCSGTAAFETRPSTS